LPSRVLDRQLAGGFLGFAYLLNKTSN